MSVRIALAPRRHRHHYHGVFAPHSPLRSLVTAQAGKGLANSATAEVRVATATKPLPDAQPVSPARRRAAYAWVRLLARIYEVLPLVCPRCGAEMRLIAFITSPDAIGAILTCLGEPTTPPPLAPRARAPPEFDLADQAAHQTPSQPPSPC